MFSKDYANERTLKNLESSSSNLQYTQTAIQERLRAIENTLARIERQLILNPPMESKPTTYIFETVISIFTLGLFFILMLLAHHHHIG